MSNLTVPPVVGQDIQAILRWARQVSLVVNEFVRRNTTGAFFIWDDGCVTVPTSTDIDGAEELVFESPFSGNGTLIVAGIGFEGGVHVALNGTDLGTLSDDNTSDEILYEVQVTNLIDGLNSFKIWSTTADTGELRRLEAWRNFSRELIDTAGSTAEWGSVTGAGKPEDNADVTANHAINAVDNPEFEAGDVSWTKTASWAIVEDAVEARRGSWVARVTSGASGSGIDSNSRLQVAAGDRVLGQGHMRKAAGDGELRVFVTWLDSTGSVISSSTGNHISSSTFALSRVVAVAPSGAVSVYVSAQVADGTSTGGYVDGMFLSIIPKDADIDALNTTNGPAESGADVTADNGQPPDWLTALVASGHIDAASVELVLDALNLINAPAESGADVTSANGQPPSWLTALIESGQIDAASVEAVLDALNMVNAPAEAGADVTGANTADDVNVGGGRNVEETGADKTTNNLVLKGDADTNQAVGASLGSTESTSNGGGTTEWQPLRSFVTNFTGTFRLMVEARKDFSLGSTSDDGGWRLKNGAGTVVHTETISLETFSETFSDEETVTTAGEVWTIEALSKTDLSTFVLETEIRDTEVRARFDHVIFS